MNSRKVIVCRVLVGAVMGLAVITSCQAPHRQSDLQKALRCRALLGYTERDGTPMAQVVYLYDSPSLTARNVFLWCGREARILDATDTEWCRVEVRSDAVIAKERRAKGGLNTGWVKASEVHPLDEIVGTLTAQRIASDVACDLRSSPKDVCRGDTVTVEASFRNMADAVRTVHFIGVRLRNTLTGAPLNLEGDTGAARTENIPPKGEIRISRQVRIGPAAKGSPDTSQAYVVYALYAVRRGPDGPVPVRMISDFHEIVVKE